MKLSDIPSNLTAASLAELCACDPGKDRCALAYFRSRELVHVGFTDTTRGFVFPGPELAIELPQVYGGPREEDPNDLIDVAYAAGFVAGLRKATHPKTFLPREWKKQTPKHINHHRIMQKLTLPEIATLPPETALRIKTAIDGGAYSWAGHNLLDAVGIGLVYLGRMRP